MTINLRQEDLNRALTRAELRTADSDFRATEHSRLDNFESEIQRAQNWFERMLDEPIVIAALVLVSLIAIVGVIGMSIRFHYMLQGVGL